MRTICLLLFALQLCALHGQKAVAPRTAISNQIELNNQYTDKMHRLLISITDLYRQINIQDPYIRYTCPVQPEPFYLQNAQNQSGSLGTKLSSFSTAFGQQTEAAITTCRAIETAFQQKSVALDTAFILSKIRLFQQQLYQFDSVQNIYYQAITKAHQELKLPAAARKIGDSYQNLMILFKGEIQFIRQFRYNLAEDTPTGWDTKQMIAHINQTDLLLEKIQARRTDLPYPASHFYQSSLDCVIQAQKGKKELLDGYTQEARQTDMYRNSLYLQMLNDYNACMVPFFNQWVDALHSEPFFPLKLIKKVAFIEINTHASATTTQPTPFEDIPYTNFLVKMPPPPMVEMYGALNKYMDFLNESTRITNNLLTALQNSRINRTAFPEGTYIGFYMDVFEPPVSLFQETTLWNRHLPESARKSVQDQAEVVFRIVTEMDLLRAELTRISKEKTWIKSGYGRTEAIRDRFVVLFEEYQQRRTRLYSDLEAIGNIAPPAPITDSWVKAYLSLKEVVASDKIILEEALKYYKNPAYTPVFDLSKHQSLVFHCITDEFTNLNGIEKLGRYNGLCPYSPYEDINKYAQTLQEYAAQHPKKQYHDFVYVYNNSVSEQNRFVELSPSPLLKNAIIPEIFALTAPGPARQPATSPTTPPPPKHPMLPEGAVKLKRDTIYIHDTIYLEKPPVVDKNFYSLQGYPPNNLVLLIDVSASMNMPDRLPLLQSALDTLVDLLRDPDQMAIVVFSGDAHLVLHSTSGKDKKLLKKAIKNLKTGGKTDIDAGLLEAYRVAAQRPVPKSNNKIILATDGDFVLSEKSRDMMNTFSKMTIQLSVFKFGDKPSAALKEISDTGGGNLVRITRENATIFMIAEAKKPN